MKYLVTGASGFLGSNLVKRLLKEPNDIEVYAMLRKSSSPRRLQGVESRIKIRYATLQDYPSLLEALNGIDVLFHLAANVRIGSFRSKEIYKDNVLGTENIFKAAKESGVKRIIYMSSISIFGSDITDCVCEEDIGKGRIMSTYGETKLASYYLFKDAYNEGLDITAVIPSNIYGPDDPNFGPLFKNYVQKRLKVIAGNLNANMGMVFIDDVCDGIILAAGKGKAGNSYILNSENITLINLLDKAEEITGIKKPKMKVPKGIIKSSALFAEAACRIIRQPLLLNRQSANLLYTTHPTFDSSRAKKELGWKPKDFDNTFKKTINWYIDKYGKEKKN